MPDDPRPSPANRLLDHYREEARAHGLTGSCGMRDEFTRGKETDAVLHLLAHLDGEKEVSDALDAGCGNGYLLNAVRARLAKLALTGLDLSPEMVALATSRRIPGCTVLEGDVMRMPFENASFDLVISERCIINLRRREDQETALSEISRVLRDGGHYICIEAFTDGLDELNKAREELGLPPNEQPPHNLWLDKDIFFQNVRDSFLQRDTASLGASLPSRNLLSSHYFVSRVLYPAITQREILYNTELVKFFGFLPPIGNYSPIQLYLLRKRARSAL